jgi:hypothetical protein
MLNRVFQYAQPQTRARARIGAIPGKTQWQHIAAARDLDAMIQRMRENGLAHWIGQLPRAPDTRAIENSLHQGIADIVDDVCRWLPGRWRDTRRWLQSGLLIMLVRNLLHETECDLPEGSPAVLQRIAAQPLEQRYEALEAAGYAQHLEKNHALWLQQWLEEFSAVCPTLSGREAYAIARIKRLLHEHNNALLNARRLAYQAKTHYLPGDPAQWRLREQLTDRLRGLLGYETFHAGLLFLYLLLELLQAERCRALLLSRVHGWDAVGVV